MGFGGFRVEVGGLRVGFSCGFGMPHPTLSTTLNPLQH